jgi:ferredoxin-nitrate reductase
MSSLQPDGLSRPEVSYCPTCAASSPEKGRLTRPGVRSSRKAEFLSVDWPEAVAKLSTRLAEIVTRYGPSSVGFLGGDLDSEAAYLVSKLIKGSIGSNQTDSVHGPEIRSAMNAYRGTFGSDACPPCFDDIDNADCVIVWGCNLAATHPELAARLETKTQGDSCFRLIEINSSPASSISDLSIHLRTADAATIALCNAIGRLMIETDAIDHRFIAGRTSSFDHFFHFVMREDLQQLILDSGLDESELRSFVRLVGQSKNILSLVTPSFANPASAAQYQSLMNLHLLTGQLSRPGAGPLLLLPGANGRGLHETGLLADELPGYRSIFESCDRAGLETFWDRSHGTISSESSQSLVERLQSADAGDLKALWITGTDLDELSLDSPAVQKCLGTIELVIIQDSLDSGPLAQFADILLPRTDRSESSGTQTRDDRHVFRREAKSPAPGIALPDWDIIARVGRAMGFTGFDFRDSASIWDEYILLTSGRVCDQSGFPSRRIDQAPTRWPCHDDAQPGEDRLYLDKRFPLAEQRAKFVATRHRQPVATIASTMPPVISSNRYYVH